MENTHAKLVKEWGSAEKAQEVSRVAAQVTADEARKAVKASEVQGRLEEAALRQEADRVATIEREQEANKNQ